ncbi:Defensin-like protein [Quillaja saponaria]|uniref:Defensin-like protein n=1 Tax=Quillaja saponaria TaxID=32244 RepID=A0AAD7P5A0_QUISA|nr:Defensin-like protein [Quillaja saponaria]
MERKTLGLSFLLLLIVLVAEEMVVTKTEAQGTGRTCEALSGQFSGGCVGTTGNQQCDNICRRLEGLLSGT